MLTSAPELSQKTVSDAMHVGVKKCPRTTTLAVARMMAAHRVHAVVVSDTVQQGDSRVEAVSGVISDLDLIAAARMRSLDDISTLDMAEALASPSLGAVTAGGSRPLRDARNGSLGLSRS